MKYVKILSHEASFLNISHRMYRNRFFSLQQNSGEGKKELFLSSRCIARPFISVDVSLQIKKFKYQCSF